MFAWLVWFGLLVFWCCVCYFVMRVGDGVCDFRCELVVNSVVMLLLLSVGVNICL